LKLHALAKSLREMMDMPPDRQLSFEDKLGLLVDQEWTSRENRRVVTPRPRGQAQRRRCAPRNLCDSARGLEHSMLRELSTCQWVRSHHTCCCSERRVGKSFLPSASPTPPRQGFRALCMRVPDYRATRDRASFGRLLHMLARLAKIDVSSSTDSCSLQ